MTESVTKTLVDTKFDLETVLAWAISAKNSLESFYGFSPNQLVFGRNLNLNGETLVFMPYRYFCYYVASPNVKLYFSRKGSTT